MFLVFAVKPYAVPVILVSLVNAPPSSAFRPLGVKPFVAPVNAASITGYIIPVYVLNIVVFNLLSV